MLFIESVVSPKPIRNYAMKPKKQLIVPYKGEQVNLWDFYDEQGNLLVQQGHIWDDNLDLAERNLSDNLDNTTFIENEMPDLSFLHVTGDVDISSNNGLTNLYKLPQKIDGNLFANHCGYHDVNGLPQIGKDLYLIGTSMERKSNFIASCAAMGGGDLGIFDQYPFEDEIVRENLPVKGKIFTPMGYTRWKENNQKILLSLSEKAYTNGAKHRTLAKHLLDWYSRYIAKNDPQTNHITKRLDKDKSEYNERLEAKEQAKKAAHEESLRRAQEKARLEAEGEINKALSANHTQNTPGAKDWARRQIEGVIVPRRSIRKEKKETDTPAVAEGKDLITKIKEVQKGALVIQMSPEEVRSYVEGICTLKQRIDNYVRGQETESFPTLGKLLELRKAYLFNAINGKGAEELPPRLVKEAMEIIGYRGKGKRKETKKRREKQEAIAARNYESKRAKCVVTQRAQPTQQMPKKEDQFKIPRKLKKEVLDTLRKLFSLAIAVDRSQTQVVTGVSINLLAALQKNNQRK